MPDEDDTPTGAGRLIRKPTVKDTKNMDHGSVRNPNIIITSSGLNLVKNFFRFIELMSILKPYSFELMLALTQTLQYYVFVVFHMFGSQTSLSHFQDPSLNE